METIRIKKTVIPEEVMGKWQKIVNIMAEILTVPSAIATRVDPPQIEVLRSAQIPGNPYKSGDKDTLARHYCETVVTENRMMAAGFTAPIWIT